MSGCHRGPLYRDHGEHCPEELFQPAPSNPCLTRLAQFIAKAVEGWGIWGRHLRVSPSLPEASMLVEDHRLMWCKECWAPADGVFLAF